MHRQIFGGRRRTHRDQTSAPAARASAARARLPARAAVATAVRRSTGGFARRSSPAIDVFDVEPEERVRCAFEAILRERVAIGGSGRRETARHAHLHVTEFADHFAGEAFLPPTRPTSLMRAGQIPRRSTSVISPVDCARQAIFYRFRPDTSRTFPMPANRSAALFPTAPASLPNARPQCSRSSRPLPSTR